MNPDHLGRRYERLLFFSGPLTLVAIAVFLIAFTSTTQNERVLARCLEVATETLQTNDALLNRKWDEYQATKKKTKYYVNDYKHELEMVWIYPSIHSGCRNDVDSFLEQGADTPPRELAKALEKRASELKTTPLQFRGIEIPQKAEIGVFGTNIKINFDSLATALQISLAPVLIIWLGSLYNTRYRETLFIGRAANISLMFPHLINIYPAIDLPTLRKRSRMAFWMPPATIICVIYSFIRFCLISFIVCPAVACYLASLFLLPINGIWWISLISGVLVLIFTFSVLFAEILPWHAMRVFPGVVNK